MTIPPGFRSRELARLRGLGYTRAEISYILVGERSLLTLADIPLGFLIERWLAWWMVRPGGSLAGQRMSPNR